MTPDQRELLRDLVKAISRIERKCGPWLADPSLLDSEAGQDALDVICMQFMAVGEGLKRYERHWPGQPCSPAPASRCSRRWAATSVRCNRSLPALQLPPRHAWMRPLNTCSKP